MKKRKRQQPHALHEKPAWRCRAEWEEFVALEEDWLLLSGHQYKDDLHVLKKCLGKDRLMEFNVKNNKEHMDTTPPDTHRDEYPVSRSAQPSAVFSPAAIHPC